MIFHVWPTGHSSVVQSETSATATAASAVCSLRTAGGLWRMKLNYDGNVLWLNALKWLVWPWVRTWEFLMHTAVTCSQSTRWILLIQRMTHFRFGPPEPDTKTWIYPIKKRPHSIVRASVCRVVKLLIHQWSKHCFCCCRSVVRVSMLCSWEIQSCRSLLNAFMNCRILIQWTNVACCTDF